jgi:hypothetical protein
MYIRMCCRELSVAITTGKTPLNTLDSTVQAIRITWDALPPVGLVVNLLVNYSAVEGDSISNVDFVFPFLPTSLSLLKSTYEAALTAALPPLPAGFYTLSFQLTGIDADSYDIVYPSSGRTITVIDTSGDGYQPSAPYMTSCVHTNDGTHIQVYFDSPTDRVGAEVATPFPCDSLFTFDGASDSICQWQDTSTVQIYVYESSTGEYPLAVDSFITLAPDVLRAACDGESDVDDEALAAICAQWNTTDTHTIVVKAPADPISPSVAISAPTTISECDAFVLDLSGSRGSGSRAWETILISVVISMSGGINSGDGDSSMSNISDLNYFYNNTYNYDPPTPVPLGLFHYDPTHGAKYVIEVVLCNFLGVCSDTILHTLTVNNTIAPVLSLVGSRTRNMLRYQPLSLLSTAYVSSCDNTKSTKELSYTWHIEQDGVAMTELISSAPVKQPYSFKLPPFSLSIQSVYTVQLSVRYAVSGLSSTAVIIYVGVGDVIAVIKGGSVVTLRVGDSYDLDASASYDADVTAPTGPGSIGSTLTGSLTGSQAGLEFSWTCFRTIPLDPLACGVIFSINDTRPDVAHITSVDDTDPDTDPDPEYSASTSLITVTVTDPSSSRIDNAQVEVSVAPATSPFIVVRTSSLRVAAHHKLKLYGEVQLFVEGLVTWSVDDASISAHLDDIALTGSASSVQLAGLHLVNLVLPPGILPYKALTFTLSSGDAKSSLMVTVVGPPLPGKLTVSPTEGNEFQDKFQFSTSSWSASDSSVLPLTYVFSYVSPSDQSLNMTISARSELSYTSTFLPSGSQRYGHQLTCQVLVYNALDARAGLTRLVTVHPQFMGWSDFEMFIADKVDSAGKETILPPTIEVVGGAANIMNAVNCSLAPDSACTVLHRSACASSDHTCGTCVQGYIGEEGDSNYRCYMPTPTLPTANTTATSCTNQDDCTNAPGNENGLFDCVDSICALPQKECALGCWGHGECSMERISTGGAIASCLLGDYTCHAKCICGDGYGGSTCALTTEELTAKSRTRQNIVISLSSTVGSSEELTSEDAILLLVALVSAAGSHGDELTLEACAHLMRLIDVCVTGASASENAVPFEYMDPLLSVLDTCMSINGGTNSSSSRAADAIINIMDMYNNLVTGDMTLGEEAQVTVAQSFRTKNIALAGDISGAVILSPLTAGEAYQGQQASSVQIGENFGSSSSSIDIDSDNDGAIDDSVVHTVMMTMIAAKAQAASSASSSYNSKLSNSMRVQYYSTSSSSSGSVVSMKIVLQNNEALDYSDFDVPSYQANFTTYCSSKMPVPSVFNKTCPSGYVLFHTCNGLTTVLKSTCPDRHLRPICAVGGSNGGHTDCSVVGYSAHSTTCQCTVTLSDEGIRFLKGSDSVGMQVDVVSEYIFDDFAENLLSADDVTLQDLKGSMLVLGMFGLLWGVGLASMMILTTSGVTKKFKRVSDIPNAGAKRGTVGGRRTNAGGRDSYKKYILSYIDRMLPVVFHDPTWSWATLTNEVVAHHRYITMLCARGVGARKKRLLTGLQMLTIQTMVMFLVAIFLDMQSPADDGTCQAHVSKKACIAAKSVLDQSQSLCVWVGGSEVMGYEGTEEYACIYSEYTLSIRAVMWVCIIMAVCQAPINIMIDFLFDEVITAPSVDEYKEIKKSSGGHKKRGHLGAAMRRASSVLVSGLVKIKNSQKNKLLEWLAPQDDDGKRTKFFAGQSLRNLPDNILDMHKLIVVSLEDLNLVVSGGDERQAMVIQRGSKASKDDSMSSNLYDYEYLVTKIKQQRKQFDPDSRRTFDNRWR